MNEQQKPRIFEPVKRSKRVRQLMKRMELDPTFNDLVQSLSNVMRQHKARPHIARAASDVVIQRMREMQYGESMRETPEDRGCDRDDPACGGHAPSV